MKKIASQLARLGADRTPCREHSESVFLTSSFIFDNAEQAAQKFSEPMSEYIYSRFSNPNIKTLSNRIAILEQAPAALTTASGMAAILSLIMGVCKSGDKILCSANVFGATVQLLSNFIAKFGVDVQYVYGDIDKWRQMMCPQTALLLIETPSNPTLEILDMASLAELARKHNAILAVDNCFCPGAQLPLQWGADVVIHSATKYLDGQGRVLGGAIAGSETLLHERIYPFLRCAGPSLSPFSAWVISRGMETLSVRLRAHCESALSLASWLEAQPQISQVLYTGLPSHPAHELAMRQQNNMGGGIIAIKLNGGRDEAWRFINALSCFSITANFGDVRSTITHPATTTHSRVSEEHRAACGIGDNLVRLSIGLEDVEDLREDLTIALASI